MLESPANTLATRTLAPTSLIADPPEPTAFGSCDGTLYSENPLTMFTWTDNPADLGVSHFIGR